MNKLFNKAVLNGTTIMGDGLTYPRIPNVYTGDNEGGYQRGDMMDANAVVKMIKELTDTGEITIDELKNLINEEIQERVEGDQDQRRYTDEKIKDLIGTSPETLDTLKEIADALGEDPDFAANVWEKLAEVDQTLEDYKRASNLPKYVVSSPHIAFPSISFEQDPDGINLNVYRTNLDTGDDASVKTTNAIPQATDSMPGLMSANDKQKLDSLVNYQAGNGIDITGDTISCTLDTSLYSIVTELPETGLPNKIYLLPSTETEEGNIYTEYGYVDNKWEEIGKYKADVDLSPYSKALNLPKYVVGQDLEGEAIVAMPYDDYVDIEFKKFDLIDNRRIDDWVEIRQASASRAGVMSRYDKAKLDGIEEGAQVNTIESVSVNGTPIDPIDKHINLSEVSRTSAGILPAASNNLKGTTIPYFFNYSSPSGDSDSQIKWGKVSFIVPDKNSYSNSCKFKLIIGDNENNYHTAPYFTLIGAPYEGISVDKDDDTAIRIKTKISSDSRNILRILNDGLFVDKTSIDTGVTGIKLAGYTSDEDITLDVVDGTVNIPLATPSKTGLMSADDKSKLDSQPTIKASDATGVTDDDYVVIKKSEYQSILDRLSALENNA